MTICEIHVIKNTGSNRNIIFLKPENATLMQRSMHSLFFRKKAKFWKIRLGGIEFSTFSTGFSTGGAWEKNPTFLYILVDISETCNL